MITKLFLCVALCNARTFFEPKFHTPNTKGHEGIECSSLLPEMELSCPTFCVNMWHSSTGSYLNQTNLETACNDQEPCELPNLLLPNGDCGACADHEDLDGRLTCSGVQFHNPCEIFTGAASSSYYRPCGPMVTTVSEYYLGNDLENELTMKQCSIERNTVGDTLIPTGKKSSWFVDFPVLISKDETRENGFAQPPVEITDQNTFLTAGWMTFFGFYLLGVVLQIVFEVYKVIRERESKKAPQLKISESMISEHTYKTQETTLPTMNPAATNATQVGYLDDWLGWITFYYIIFMSVLNLVFLVFLVLDVYGFWWWACDDATKDLCNCARDSASCPPGMDSADYVFYHFRDGFSCGFACVVGYSNINGYLNHWPYWPISPDVAQYKLVFILTWHIVTLWFVVLRLFKDVIRTHYRIRSDMKSATTVSVAEPAPDPIVVESEKHTIVGRFSAFKERIYRKIMGPPMNVESITVCHEGTSKFIDFRCQRYCWSEEDLTYVQATYSPGETHKDLVENMNGLTSEDAEATQSVTGQNTIKVSVPSPLMSYFEEIFDWFYFYQFFSVVVAFHFVWWTFAITYLIIVIISSIISVTIKRAAKLRLKTIAETSTQINLIRDGKWSERSTACLVPGDVVEIKPGPITCDVALIQGRCVVDESSLTGEPNPVAKIPLEATNKVYIKSGEDAKYTLYSGTICQASTAGPDGLTKGVVVAIGAHTDKGRLIRNILFPVGMSFKFDQHWSLVFLILMVFAIVVMILTFWLLNWYIDGWYYGLATAMQIVSPLLPASFTLAQSKASSNLKKKNIFCMNLQRTAVAGKAKTACFDKTGTLTTSGLEFRGVYPIKEAVLEAHEEFPKGYPLLLNALASCHELDVITQDGVVSLVGNEVDQNMFRGSQFEFDKSQSLTFNRGEDGTKLKTLRRFEFDRKTMTSSAVVEDVGSGEMYIFSKGSPDRVADICQADLLPPTWDQKVNELGRLGEYVLGMAWKKFDADPSDLTRGEAERDLNPLGILTFSNELKQETPNVIRELKEGNIRCVMITGDSPETGIKIARQSGLSTSQRIFVARTKRSPVLNTQIVTWMDFDSDETIENIYVSKDEMENNIIELCVTGKAFTLLACQPVRRSFMMHELSKEDSLLPEEKLHESLPESQLVDLLRYTRIFARMKPEQKVVAVSMHMVDGITTMCGDGANDAAALQKSHAGVALKSGTGGDEATLVAHFSTPSESLNVFTEIIREGRSSLATMLHVYKFLIAYGEALVCLSLLMPYFNITPGEAYWIVLDTFLTTSLTVAILQGKPGKRLLPSRPTSRLLGTETVTSLVVHVFNNYLWTIIVVIVLFQQGWFRCREWDPNLADPGKWWLKGDNYESLSFGIFTMLQVASSAAVFNYGFDFRRSWLKNYWVPVAWIVWLVFYTLVLFLQGNFLSCLFRSNCGDESLMRWWGEHGGVFLDGKTLSLNFGADKSVATAPSGCGCDSQYGNPFETGCQGEYINCPDSVPQWNSVFHHTLTPIEFRYLLYGLSWANILLAFLFEGIVMVGPVRSCLRKKEAKKNNKPQLIIGDLNLRE